MDETQAIALVKRGNLTGLEALVQRYQVKAVYAAYLIVHDRQSAEDVVQTAFLYVQCFESSSQHDQVVAAHRQKKAQGITEVCLEPEVE